MLRDIPNKTKHTQIQHTFLPTPIRTQTRVCESSASYLYSGHLRPLARLYDR